MGHKGLRYRVSVYLVVSLCMILPAVVVRRYDMASLFAGMYLPAESSPNSGWYP